MGGARHRQAAILAHLEEHPGLTAGELARAFGLRAGLARYGYPPDRQAAAIELVMHQAELLAQAA